MSGVIEPLVKFLRASAQNINDGYWHETANMLEVVASGLEKKGESFWAVLVALVELNQRMRDAPFLPNKEAKAK